MSLRDIGTLLHQIGSPDAAADWATVTVALDGPAAVALLGAGALELPEGVTTVSVEHLGAALPVHAALFRTPYAAALGSDDRALIAERGVLPLAVVLTERSTLEQLSDDPEREAQEVLDRVRSLVPPGVPVLTESEVDAWLASLTNSDQLAERRSTLALHLIDQANAHRSARLSQIVARRAAIAEQLAELDSRVRAAARGGEHVASGVRAATMTAGEALQADLDAFFQQLRISLPRELNALEDWRSLRTHLGPWLQHVITAGIEQALANWTARLLAEVGPLLSEDEQQNALGGDATEVELATLADVTGWRDRLPIALGLGGGVALVAIGQVIPGAITMFSSLAWRSATHEARLASRRDALLDSAQTVVDVARVETLSAVRSRRETLLAALDALPKARAQRTRDQQRDERTALVAEQETLQRERSTLVHEQSELRDAREGWSEVPCRS